MTEVTTIEQPNSTSSNSFDSTNNQKRLCWVCFGTEQDDEELDNVWVCPCQCKGTMKFVHEECLQRWIDEKQKRTNSCRVSCSQCKTFYILSYPPSNRLVRLIERYDKFLDGSSPFLAVSLVAGSIYWSCGSLGFLSIIQFMGYEEAKRAIEDADPLLLIIGLPIIPIALIAAKLIKWEDFILKIWRSNAIKLPRPLSYIIEEPPARQRVNCDHLLVDKGFQDPIACTRLICGALLLPTLSALVGKIFFSSMSGSQWRRSLVGGLAFLLVKGLTKVYFRKSRYIKYSQRCINNFPAKASSSDRSSFLFPEAGGSGLGSGQDVDNVDSQNEIEANIRDVRMQEEDSDDDEAAVEPRGALFSMTIRI